MCLLTHLLTTSLTTSLSLPSPINPSIPLSFFFLTESAKILRTVAQETKLPHATTERLESSQTPTIRSSSLLTQQHQSHNAPDTHTPDVQETNAPSHVFSPFSFLLFLAIVVSFTSPDAADIGGMLQCGGPSGGSVCGAEWFEKMVSGCY
jgi:hypothetical protein